MGRGKMYKTDQFDRKIGINGYLFDKLEATAETWQPVSVRNDPRLERDNSRDARPVNLPSGRTWADAMRSRRKKEKR